MKWGKSGPPVRGNNRAPSARRSPGGGIRRGLLLAAAFVAAATVVSFAPPAGRSAEAAGGPPDTSVMAWGEALEKAFSGVGQTPAEGNTYNGLVHYAIYDAVVTIKGGYEPVVYRASRQPNASVEAAVAAAGRGMLVKLFPTQAAIAEELYASQLASVADGAAKTAGIKVGEGAASAVLALPIVGQIAPGLPYVAPNPPVPGVYEPTSPQPAAVIGVWLSKATPVLMGSRAQFRPSGTLPITSLGYATDFTEVKEVGSKTSTTRTAAQTDQALFWSEPPVQQALRSLRGFVKERNMDVVDAARFMAMTGAVYQEGMLACFDAKAALPAWRPVTAIRRADLDGNDATTKDEAWEPLIGTPNHAEYPSAHSCVSVGIGSIVERFLGGSPFSYTMVSVAGRPSRTFASAADLAKDVANARVYGGIHFRQATIDGSLISRQVADLVINNYFRPTQSGGTAPVPPNTGDTAADDRSGFSTALLAGGTVLVAATGFVSVWLRKRTTNW